MSYSHALDGELAPALQSAVEQFGRVWYRRRAVRLFRDTTNLAATPHLWGSIEQALERSDWFILLASPESARSMWVRREVDWWLTHRSADRLTVAVTGGSLAWDATTGRIDELRTDALPPAFAERGLPEPLWVDLRPLRAAEPTDPAFQAAVVDLAATLRGIPKDELVGDQIREHRRRRRTIALAAVTLVVLTLISVVTAGFALVQRDRAEEQTRIATARQLAGAAEASAAGRVDLARLLAAQAYRLQPDERSRAALLTATTAGAQVRRFVATTSPITGLATSSDGDEFVIGTADGQVRVVDDTGRPVFQVANAPQPTTVVALDADGHRVVAGNGAALLAWNRATPDAGPDRVPVADHVAAVALSASGERIALLGGPVHGSDTPVRGRIQFLDGDLAELASGEVDVFLRGPGFPGEGSDHRVVFDSESTVHVASGACRHQVVRTDATVVSTRPMACNVPANSYIEATSASAVAGAYFKAGEAHVFTDTDVDEGRTFSLPLDRGEVMAVSATLDLVAVAQSGVVAVAGQNGHRSMSGASHIGDLEFLRGGTLVAAAEGGAVLFDVDGVSPVARETDVWTDDWVGYITRPEIRISPDAGSAAVVSEDRTVTVIDLRTALPRTSLDASDLGHPVKAAWSPDGTSVTAIGDRGRARVWWLDGDGVGRTEELPGLPDEVPFGQLDGAEYAPDGTLWLRALQGDVVERLPDGTARLVVPEFPDYVITALSPKARYAVRASGTALDVVDLDTGRPTATLTLGALPAGLTFPDDDRALLTQADGTTTLITLADGATRRSVSVDAGNFDSVVAAGGTVATLGLDGILAFQDLDGRSLGRFHLPSSAPRQAWDITATAVALTPDAKTMVTATSGGGVLVWSLDPETQVSIACDAAGHDLTAADWAVHVGTQPPDDLGCGA
jgi:WD40 repeat protein